MKSETFAATFPKSAITDSVGWGELSLLDSTQIIFHYFDFKTKNILLID